MNRAALLTCALAVVAAGCAGTAGTASAQYLGNVGNDGATGKHTLEEALKIQRDRIEAVQNNPGAGSGTPYLDASSIVGATIISGAVFGAVAGAFLIRGRSGKYAEQGRG